MTFVFPLSLCRAIYSTYKNETEEAKMTEINMGHQVILVEPPNNNIHPVLSPLQSFYWNEIIHIQRKTILERFAAIHTEGPE